MKLIRSCVTLLWLTTYGYSWCPEFSLSLRNKTDEPLRFCSYTPDGRRPVSPEIDLAAGSEEQSFRVQIGEKVRAFTPITPTKIVYVLTVRPEHRDKIFAISGGSGSFYSPSVSSRGGRTPQPLVLNEE